MTVVDPAAGGGAASLAVARRDLLEFVRDRRTLFITLLMPMVMYPVLALSSVLGLRTALSDIEARQSPCRLTLAVGGADAASFAARLRAVVEAASAERPADWPAAVVVEVPAADEMAGMLDAGRADIAVVTGPETVRRLDGDETVRLDARSSAVRPIPERVRRHFLAVVRAVADDARSRRVARAGLAPTTLTPLSVDFVAGGPVAADATQGVLPTAAGAVLVLLSMLTATGAFYPAIDAIAGEKERGTIETLLIAPCRPWDLVCGKYLAVLAVTLATLVTNVISLVLTAAVLARYLPAGFMGHGAAGLAGCLAVAVVVYLGLASVAAALCLAVTSAARSAKEAQNTLTPVILLVSGLAGVALLPGPSTAALAAVPFAGQVAVAKAMLVDDASPGVADDERWGTAWRLVVSLASSAACTWLLLQATTNAISDEELLFRGPDAAAARRWRPARRPLPTPGQAVAAAACGLAGLWYAQGIAPADLVCGLPVQLALATLVPLVILGCWQRVDLVETFRLRWPAATTGRGLACLAAAAAAGVALFVVGAAAFLAIRGSHLSPAARQLAEKLVDLLDTQPWWVSWCLVAVLPAVCEETLFRGWMLAGLVGPRPTPVRRWTAIGLQAACFAAFHLLPERMPQTFVLGLVLGWLTLRCGSILPAVLAHLAHNGVPVWLHAVAVEAPAARRSTAATVALADGVVAAAVGCGVVALAVIWLTTRAVRAERGMMARRDA